VEGMSYQLFIWCLFGLLWFAIGVACGLLFSRRVVRKQDAAILKLKQKIEATTETLPRDYGFSADKNRAQLQHRVRDVRPGGGLRR
jgi:hypothetical protein